MRPVTRSAVAGAYFPQFVTADGTARLDEFLGEGPCLIGRGSLPTFADLKLIDIAAGEAGEFASDLSGWLSRHNAEAVLVRPDRYIFGTGAPATLARVWGRTVRPQPA